MPTWKSLLDQMFVMAGDGLEDTRKADSEALGLKLGYEPLRLVLTGDAKYMLYASPKEEECDNRLEPHAWVHPDHHGAGQGGVPRYAAAGRFYPSAMPR